MTPGLSSALEIEKAALDRFKANAHSHLPGPIPGDNDILEWWAIMQHYGAPTRLLDWTLSPYVAAYFAVTGEWNKPGAIWVFDSNSLDKSLQSTHGSPTIPPAPADQAAFYLTTSSPEIIHPLLLSKHNVRMASQQSVFTVCGRLLSDHGKLIEAAMAGPRPNATLVFMIKPELKLDFLGRLRGMNITGASLFPGSDGLGRDISEFVRIGSTIR